MLVVVIALKIVASKDVMAHLIIWVQNCLFSLSFAPVSCLCECGCRGKVTNLLAVDVVSVVARLLFYSCSSVVPSLVSHFLIHMLV